jgi:superfamily II DNA or RNA helicase
VFCRSLFKVVTKYMLGLSATMNRKDGLTKVFKYFIGNVAYKEKREGDDSVLVKLINYKNDDPDFSETVYNFKGQVHYAIMIRKLCEFNHRTEFVLKVLQDILTSKTNDQIMILAHNKSVLKYLHDAIEHRNIATVGYYVGGMKEAALKETESKQVVIATYAMAEEALDIKTLSCLIMATPKTDVTQAVGRILRMKHKQPLVVDIVDQHDIFQRQSIKRLRFYKKCNYRIIETDSNAYLSHKSKNNDINDTHWKTLYDPSKNIKAALKKGTTKKTGCNIKVNTDSQQNENSKELEKQKKIEDLLDIKIKKTERGKLLQGKCLL